MKSTILVFILVAMACCISRGNSEQFETNCNNVKGDLSLHYKMCGRIHCNPDGSISAVGCGQYSCKDGVRPIRTIETDTSKPYPECCGGPVCPD